MSIANLHLPQVEGLAALLHRFPIPSAASRGVPCPTRNHFGQAYKVTDSNQLVSILVTWVQAPIRIAVSAEETFRLTSIDG